MTALQEELERLKAELLAQEGKENEEVELEEPEETGDEEKVEEKEPEEEKKEVVEEKKPELDDAGYARLRREAAAEKKRADQAMKELEELRRVKEPEVEIEQPVIPPQLLPIIERDQIAQAEREFSIFEGRVKQNHPEYGAIASEYAAALYQSFKVQNPRKSEIELNDMTKKAILIKAGEFARAGYENPVEEMYYEAKELGFTGKSFQKEVKETEERLQPDMKKVAENRKRSSGMAATNGRQEGMMTLEMAASLPSGEFAKLSKTERRRLMYGQ